MSPAATVAAPWDDVFSTRAWGRWPAEEVVRAVARLSRGRRMRVLEIGSGAGAQLWYLEHEGHDAFGVDLSREGARRATQRLRDEGSPARLAVGDALALPLPDATFDLVLDVEALVYVPEDRTAGAWREVARVLRAGGSFLSIAFTPRSYAWHQARRVGERSVEDIVDGPLAGTPCTAFVDEGVVRVLARDAGLDVVEIQRRGRSAGPEQHWIDELVVLAERSGVS
jgi:SAM-dependent methyltransferase